MLSATARLSIFVESSLVTPRPPPPMPPPVPGTVTPEMLRAPKPKHEFLVPWRQYTDAPRDSLANSIPVTIDPKQLAAYTAEHIAGMIECLNAVFRDDRNREQIVADVIKSMENPFASNSSSIVWTLDPVVHRDPLLATKLGGKKKEQRHRALLQGQPWSIKCFAGEGGGPRKNVIYNEEGHAIAQVDFGHSSVGIHCHDLARFSLDHRPVEDPAHLFRLSNGVPWAWCVIPQVDKAKAQHIVSRRTGEDADEDDADDVDELMNLALPLPDLDAFHESWTLVSVPYENYMGSASASS